jgi:hypothetical protein
MDLLVLCFALLSANGFQPVDRLGTAKMNLLEIPSRATRLGLFSGSWAIFLTAVILFSNLGYFLPQKKATFYI